MIRLTRLNNQSLVVNSDLIKFVEQAPETLITLVNGEKFMVREAPEQVIQLIVEFRRTVLRRAFPAWDQIARLSAAAGAPLSEAVDHTER